MIFLKKKLALLCVLVVLFSGMAGCERAPYMPTPLDRVLELAAWVQQTTDAELQVQFRMTFDKDAAQPGVSSAPRPWMP